jgi:hypothetical protein
VGHGDPLLVDCCLNSLQDDGGFGAPQTLRESGEL